MPGRNLSHPFFTLYRVLWRVARIFLRRSPRLAEGWEARLVPQDWLEPELTPADAEDRCADVWLQAASGGEARLAEAICRDLDPSLPLRLLITTWTAQGRDVANGFLPALKLSHPLLKAAVRFAPLDSPEHVCRALSLARPRLVALLETELWPGLMAACRDMGIPVIVLNGRINQSTARFGKFFSSLTRNIAPESVFAVSEEDGSRFSAMFRCPVRVMPNVKFDLSMSSLDSPPKPHELSSCFKGRVYLFASVRSGELKRLPRCFCEIVKADPRAVIIAAPRHMYAAAEWRDLMEDLGLRPLLASSLSPGAEVPCGHTVVWDRFGDLPQLYALAAAAFVGGTFTQGGQNFLEPLAAGIIPCVGPSTENFGWALSQGAGGAPSLEEAGLLHRVRSPGDAVRFMIASAEAPLGRDRVRQRYSAWLAARTGGAVLCAREIERRLRQD